METDEILSGAECCWELVWIYPWAGSPAPQATSRFPSVTPILLCLQCSSLGLAPPQLYRPAGVLPAQLFVPSPQLSVSRPQGCSVYIFLIYFLIKAKSSRRGPVPFNSRAM